MSNSNLNVAKINKNDEFYTQMKDVEAELQHYSSHFRGKVIYCNCDNPSQSNFYKYFAAKYTALGLKDLLFNAYQDENHGDFRSEQAIAKLKRADIVVTNPPFSLFREFTAQLQGYGKKFLILGSMNAITYRELFPLMRDGSIWLGTNNGAKEYDKPDGTTQKLGNTCWFTNLEHPKRNEEITLTKQYDPAGLHLKHDNYDCIECKYVKNIPVGYAGPIAVPISYMTRHNPSQFEILNANDLRVNESVPIKPHGLIQDKEGRVNGLGTYARIVIRNLNPGVK